MSRPSRPRRVAGAEDDVRPACGGQAVAVADHLIRAEVADSSDLDTSPFAAMAPPPLIAATSFVIWAASSSREA
ncbi:MAG TPA: hypothetical protein VG009_07395 [Candidatus Dormibacteraeota bacterium]|nr:hypothetical protein [Candidatus Dormibacteraeota bacterium]